MHAIDTEYEVTAAPVPRIVCAQIAGPSGCGLFHQSDPATPLAIREVLRTGAYFAMAPADVTVIWGRWPELLPDILDAYEDDRVVDVLTQEKLIDIATGETGPHMGYSLADVVRRRCGFELSKGEDTWRLRYGELLDVPLAQWPKEASEYALNDAAGTYAAGELQRKAFGGLLGDAPRQARGHIALYIQSLRGIRVDPAQVRRVDAMLSAEIERLTQECLRHGLAEPKTKKPGAKIKRNTKIAAQMLVEYCERTGQTVPRLEPTEKAIERGEVEGNISLSEESMNELHIELGHPLDSYRRLGSLTSMRTGWVPPLSHPYIYTKYTDLVESGRTSSSGYDRKRKPPHPRAACSRNLQNFPKEHTLKKLGVPHVDIRGCLVPRPGYRFIISDFSALELVTLAQVQLDWFGRSALADVLRDPKRGDPHGEFAADMMGIPYPADRKHPGPGEFDAKIPEHKIWRGGGKGYMFGKPGGMGQTRFIAHVRDEYGFEMTPEEETRHSQKWHRKFPEMQMFFDEVKRRWRDRNGRFNVVQPRSGRIRGDLGFPDACNTHFQGLGADIAKLALWRLFRASVTPTSPLFCCAQVLFVHDEAVTEAPIDRADAALAEQERIMIEAGAYWCPDVPIKVESSISDRYNK